MGSQHDVSPLRTAVFLAVFPWDAAIAQMDDHTTWLTIYRLPPQPPVEWLL